MSCFRRRIYDSFFIILEFSPTKSFYFFFQECTIIQNFHLYLLFFFFAQSHPNNTIDENLLLNILFTCIIWRLYNHHTKKAICVTHTIKLYFITFFLSYKFNIKYLSFCCMYVWMHDLIIHLKLIKFRY